MMLAGASLGSSALASLTPLSTATSDDQALQPLNVYLNGIQWTQWVQCNTLQIDDTLGEQVTCTLTIVNAFSAPALGDSIEVRYYSQTLFAGTIDNIVRSVNNTLTVKTWECSCTDWSQILMRRIIRRNFTNMSINQVCSSLLDNELSGENLTLGHSDSALSIPLIDSQSGRAFDVLRDAAGVTGQTMYVDFNKSIQFRSTSNDAAPLALDITNIETASLRTDRETYRNAQTVVVTGTPAANTDAATVIIARQDDDQIASRIAVEGGTGIYERLEEVTHPTSNDPASLGLLGIGYALLRLSTSGQPRQILSCRVRSYGFRAGQFASVTIESLSISGTWLIQRVSISDSDGKGLVHSMELVQSSLQERAYESWLSIVKAGKVTVQMPSAQTNNSQLYNTPGSYSFTVPAGVTTLEIEVLGASGGGAGGLKIIQPSTGGIYDAANGGDGGNGGRAVSIVSVVAGQSIDIVVASKGSGGARASYAASVSPPQYSGAGTAASGASYAQRSGVTLCQGNGGGGGAGAKASGTTATDGAKGSNGSGVGDVVTVGGGKAGGAGGHGYNPYSNGSAGQDGSVEVRW